jgi:hypothetical protein
MKDKFVSVSTAAQKLGVHIRYVDVLWKKHGFQKYKILSRTVVKRKDVEKLLIPVPVNDK